jgi:organic hydroperoxide reductase OsmC/OhrA
MCDDPHVALTEKELRYTVMLDGDGALRTDTGATLEEASAEHLLLGALLRCSAQSLRYSARRRGVATVEVSGSAKGVVQRREEDGRYAVVRSDVTLDVELDPKPSRAEASEILGWAERGCFVGSSLAAKPTYHWNLV